MSKEKFFKTFGIKEKWWDGHYDFPEKRCGDYSSYNDMYNSLKNNNGWEEKVTKEVIKKECFKSYPRITNNAIIELMEALLKYKEQIQINNKEDFTEQLLQCCMDNKDLIYEDIRKIFGE